MSNLTFPIVSQFLVAIIANVAALIALPLTAGFTKFVPTALCVSLLVLNLFMMSRLIQSGISLSGLIPLITGIIPLTMILVGIFHYGENGSPLRIGLLLGACALASAAAAVQA